MTGLLRHSQYVVGAYQKSAPGCKRQGTGDNMLFWAMFCGDILGSAIHVNVTASCTTYLNTVVDKVHPLMAMVFPNDGLLFQQDNASCHTANMVQEWFEEHDNCSLGLQSAQISVQCSICGINQSIPWAQKGSAANILVSQHTFIGLVESMGQSCFDGMTGMYIIIGG